jgi:hypothetical protein
VQSERSKARGGAVRLEERQSERRAERRGRSVVAGRPEGQHGEDGAAAREKGVTARPERKAGQEGWRSGGPRRSGGWRGEAAGHQARVRERRKREAAGGGCRLGRERNIRVKRRELSTYMTTWGLLMGRC